MTPPPPASRPSRLQRRVVEIDTVGEFDAMAAWSSDMVGWRVRHLDLRDRTAAIVGLDPAGALFLGCELESAAVSHLTDGGALVYPDAPAAPVDEYRATLYTPAELYDGLSTSGYRRTPDARIYAWSQQRPVDERHIVVRALHDAAVEGALDRILLGVGKPVVGVMGGHGVTRGTADYAAAAKLGRALARDGAVVATGGGPGAMEAANLGALLASHPDDALEAALETLSAVPSFRPSIDKWANAAMAVRRDVGADEPGATNGPPPGGVGVPTWFYCHEPSNLFAGTVAKFFQNSVREATLLNRCTGGIVFLPGAAGTVQEIFQDACENYYAAPDTRAPMVLVDRCHWTETLPAYPLLHAMARAQGFEATVTLVDTVDEAATAIAAMSVPLRTLNGTRDSMAVGHLDG
ncbi:LOG family protein [soil metagenome]